LIVKAESESDDRKVWQLCVDVADRSQIPRAPKSNDARGPMAGGDDVDGHALGDRRERDGVDGRLASAAGDQISVDSEERQRGICRGGVDVVGLGDDDEVARHAADCHVLGRRLEVDAANVGRFPEVPDDAGAVFGSGDANPELDAGSETVDAIAVSEKFYETVASVRVKLESEVPMLECVTDCDDLAGGEPEPEEVCVGADVDGLQLVVVVHVEDRKDWLRRRVFLEPNPEVSIAGAPGDQACTQHVGHHEGGDEVVAVLLDDKS